MNLKINLITLIGLIAVFNVVNAANPAALYIRQRAEDALRQQMIKSRSAPMLRSSISSCHPHYSDILNNLLSTYENDVKACEDNESKQLVELSNEGQQSRDATTSSLKAVCTSFEECQGKTENLEFFDCVNNSGDKNTRDVWKASKDSSDTAAHIREQIHVIKYQTGRCTNDAERQYIVGTTKATDDMMACYANGGVIPPPSTDAPATDAPTTDAPATDVPTTDAPATEAPATDAPVTDAPATDAPSSTQMGIVGISVCICMVNAFDENDYNNEPRDVSLEIHHQQQQPYRFENLQRLRMKLQDGGAQYQNENTNSNNNGRRENYRNTYINDPRLEEERMSKDQGIKSATKPHQNTNNQPKFNEMEFFDEFESNLPYGIQNVRRDLSSRSNRNQPRLHKPKTTFQSLCPSKRLVIPLETIEYVYRPDHYEEVTCYHSYAPNRDYLSETNKVCSEAGFTCIQLNRTVYLTRRAKGSECWESETRIVPSGCECMWPKHTFGDIITYH